MQRHTTGTGKAPGWLVVRVPPGAPCEVPGHRERVPRDLVCVGGTATTRGSSTSASIADVFAVDNALPAGARTGNAENTPAALIDRQLREASSMPSTTTSGTVLAMAT